MRFLRTRVKDKVFAVMDHGTDEELGRVLKTVDETLTSEILDASKEKIKAKITLQKIEHICSMKGCKDWIPVEKDVLPKEYTPVRDFMIQNASENASVSGDQFIDMKKIVQFVITFLPDSMTNVIQPFKWVTANNEVKPFTMPIRSSALVSQDNRFGVSRRDVKKFVQAMIALRRNGELVRTHLFWTAPTPDQIDQTEAYLWYLHHNKEILQKIGLASYTYRPLES